MIVEKEDIAVVLIISSFIFPLVFTSFLSILLLKYLFYDNGFHFSNINLLICLIFTRIYLFETEWKKLAEKVVKHTGHEILWQKLEEEKQKDEEKEEEEEEERVSTKPVKLHKVIQPNKQISRLAEAACLVVFILFDKSLLGIGNILLIMGVTSIREQLHDKEEMKEISSFICGLIYLLMGWFSVGKILVIYFLLMFCCYIVFVIGPRVGLKVVIAFILAIVQDIANKIAKKLRGEKSNAVEENVKNELNR